MSVNYIELKSEIYNIIKYYPCNNTFTAYDIYDKLPECYKNDENTDFVIQTIKNVIEYFIKDMEVFKIGENTDLYMTTKLSIRMMNNGVKTRLININREFVIFDSNGIKIGTCTYDEETGQVVGEIDSLLFNTLNNGQEKKSFSIKLN